MGLDVSVSCHLDTAQCTGRILKDSGRFLVKIPWGLGLNMEMVISLIWLYQEAASYLVWLHNFLV